MRKRRAVIFGVTGQDGGYLSELLLNKDYEVTGIARRVSVPTDQRLSIAYQISRKSGGFTLEEGDITDLSSVFRLLDKVQPDEIYNLAAQSHVKTSFDEPFHTTNVVYNGCLNILEWLRSWHAKQSYPCTGPRFYQASSSEMFGSSRTWKMTEPEMFDDGHHDPEKVGIYFQDESTPFSPCSPYAIAKLAAHHAVDVYRKSYGIHASSGILFNHESERRGQAFVSRKISRYVAQLMNGTQKFMLELGNLDAKRDWGHAEDYVRTMWLMLQQDIGDDYVIGTGVAHSVRDFLNVAFTYAGIPDWSAYVHINPSLFRPNEVPYLCASPAYAKAKLSWEPKISFEQLVHRMIDHDRKELANGLQSN